MSQDSSARNEVGGFRRALATPLRRLSALPPGTSRTFVGSRPIHVFWMRAASPGVVPTLRGAGVLGPLQTEPPPGSGTERGISIPPRPKVTLRSAGRLHTSRRASGLLGRGSHAAPGSGAFFSPQHHPSILGTSGAILAGHPPAGLVAASSPSLLVVKSRCSSPPPHHGLCCAPPGP